MSAGLIGTHPLAWLGADQAARRRCATPSCFRRPWGWGRVVGVRKPLRCGGAATGHRDHLAKGARFACPACGAAGCPAYDTEQLTWRHLSFFQHEAYLTARVPRISCQACGIRQVSVPWARAGSGFTLLFEAFVMALVASMPVAVVARTVGEHDPKLWRVVHHDVEQARARADHCEVRRVAFDETASRRGHNYVSLFVDL